MGTLRGSNSVTFIFSAFSVGVSYLRNKVASSSKILSFKSSPHFGKTMPFREPYTQSRNFSSWYEWWKIHTEVPVHIPVSSVENKSNIFFRTNE